MSKKRLNKFYYFHSIDTSINKIIKDKNCNINNAKKASNKETDSLVDAFKKIKFKF